VAEQTSEKQSGEDTEQSGDGQQGQAQQGEKQQGEKQQGERQDGEKQQAEGQQGSGAGKAAAGAGALAFLKRGRRREGTERRRGGRGVLSGGLALLGRLIGLVLSLCAAIIILAILVKVFGANRENLIVESLISAGDFLVGPLEGIFTFDSRDTEVAVNWGIAAALYLIVGAIVSRILGR
jgi:hypothetical protein